MEIFKGGAAALAALLSNPQDKRLLRMEFPRKDGPKGATMLANTLDAVEELSRDFTYTVEVLSNDATIPLKSVMAKMVTISLVRDDGSLRFFNGYVFEFQFVRTDGGFAFYHMVLKPWLAFLRLRQDNAVFQNANVVDLCEKTFAHYVERDVKYRVTGDHPPLTLAVQYNETDHNHLHRRLEDSGLFYWYEHRLDGHTLWLSDDSTQAEPIDGPAPEMAFQSGAGSLEDDGVHQWSAMRRVAAGRVTLGSFDFKDIQRTAAFFPSVQKHGGVSELEIYEHTGAYGFNHAYAHTLACLRTEEIEARDQDFAAQSNDRTAQPGRWFTLSGHFSGGTRRRQPGEPEPDDRSDRPYLVIRVHHRARNNYQDGRDALSDYENDFRCMRKSIPWRPTRGWNSEPTKIYGVQTATVVGPPGEEIHTDEYGRVRLQFHWDRNGIFDAASSPWVRVVSSWAGAKFGQISLPRIDQEVVVQFLDGNCDRPLIIGSVYNSRNMPPWELPACKTQSGILTRSTVGGGLSTANALRFEDKKGAEEIWLHAEKDQRIEVEHDETHWVGQDRRKAIDRDETVEVKRDRNETVGRNETTVIGQDRTERVGNNEHITIGGLKSERIRLTKEESVGFGKALTIGGAYQVSVVAAMNTSVGLSQSSQVGLSKRTSVGSRYSVEAGEEISIAVGAASLTMRSDGSIALHGTSIRIEASGQVIVNGKSVDLNNAPGGHAVRPAIASAAEDANPSGASAAAAQPTGPSGPAAADGQTTGGTTRATAELSRFTLAEQKKINTAIDKAEQLLAAKSEALHRWNQADRDEFFGVFGTDTEETHQIILKRTDRLLGLTKGMSAADSFFPGTAEDMDISEEEFAGVYAYVNPDETHLMVHTGPKLLTGDGGASDPAGGIIVHELSHLSNDTDCTTDFLHPTCGTGDGYIDPKTGAPAVNENGSVIGLYGPGQSRALTSDQTLFHASSYQMYVVGKPAGRTRG
ncbi:MAG: tssI [Massilia sp.]|nr:tssI [Massilia sp.]